MVIGYVETAKRRWKDKMANVSLNHVSKYIDEVFTPTSFNGEKKCELCNLSRRTKWYYEDEKWIICDCKTCNRPMVVYKKHTMFIPILDWVKVLGYVTELFGNEIVLRFKQRKIRNHFHIHIYKKLK